MAEEFKYSQKCRCNDAIICTPSSYKLHKELIMTKENKLVNLMRKNVTLYILVQTLYYFN